MAGIAAPIRVDGEWKDGRGGRAFLSALSDAALVWPRCCEARTKVRRTRAGGFRRGSGAVGVVFDLADVARFQNLIRGCRVVAGLAGEQEAEERVEAPDVAADAVGVDLHVAAKGGGQLFVEFLREGPGVAF